MQRKTLKKSVIGLFVTLLVGGAAGTVAAGYKLESEVKVTATSASGSIGSARNSADTKQYIQCSISGTSSSKTVSCAASDSAGNFFSCTGNSNADHLAAAVAAIGSNSKVIVYGTNGGACTQIISYNGSQHKPAVP
jgi:hypothetical protein